MSHPVRESHPNMQWFERLSKALKARGVSNAEIGRQLGVTGQSITHKLKGVRPIQAEELAVMARLAGMTTDQALGGDAVVIQGEREMGLFELYRVMTVEQQQRMLDNAKDVAGERLREQKEADAKQEG